MKSQAIKRVGAASAFALSALCLSPSANASLYTFTQTGFSGGGVIKGSFEGEDLNHDGQIAYIFDLLPSPDATDTGTGADEVTSFSFSFSGDSVIQSFSHGFNELQGLVYDVGTRFLGDGTGSSITDTLEGLISDSQTPATNTGNFQYSSGLAITGTFGASVTNKDSGAISSTSALIAVTSHEPPKVVPVPAAFSLFASGLFGLGLFRRKKAI